MDGIGAGVVKTADGLDTLGGEFVGDGYVDLLYNGTNWIFLYSREFIWNALTGGGGVIIGQQKFTASGTYTPTPGTECCVIECLGGGGGGGSSSSVDVNNGSGGGGGGAGGYSRKLATAGDIGASQIVTVGAAGTGVGQDGASGIAGGATSVGTLCVANGGGGGVGAVASQGAPGGFGGTVGTGDHTGTGENGFAGRGVIATDVLGSSGGHGGNSIWGGGGRDQSCVSQVIGESATGFGAGGAGGASFQNAGGAAGGSGSPGGVIITEFAGRGAPGRDGPAGPVGPVGPSGAGTGDVLRSGTPTAGQYAVWTDASHIQGVTPPSTAPQRTVFTSGSGTYTTPVGATWLDVELVGGGAGGYCRKLIAPPAATYSYSVGAGGNGAAVNGNNFGGGAGGSGIIIITAHFGG
jgi:hypothetical protein